MMQTETALGEKLKRGGFIPREVRFSIAIAEFLNNGGTVERAHQLIAIAADKMELPGQSATVREGQSTFARQPNGDGAGHTIRAERGQPLVARPSPAERERGGQTKDADKASYVVPPAREPSTADRAAARAVKKQVAATLSGYAHRLRDGRPLHELSFHELGKYASEDFREGRALLWIEATVRRRVANPDPFAKVPELVSEREVEEAFDFAKVAENVH